MDLYLKFYSNQNVCIAHNNDSFNMHNVVDKSFFIFHQNIRSFNFNIEEFLLHTDNLNIDPHVNMLSETWFCDVDFHDIYIYIYCYTGYRTYRIDRGEEGCQFM